MKFELNSTHIWYFAFKNEKLIKTTILFKFLDKKEQKRANSYFKEKDKQNYIISHGYLRLLLTKYYSKIKPDEWEFIYNKYGKPSLSEKHNVRLFFNLSHTDKYMAIIFDPINECGIDIEEEQNIVLDNNLLDLVLSQEEKKKYYLSKDKKTTFYKLWTLKEAYVKALGIGFKDSPNKIDFSFIEDITQDIVGLYTENNMQYGTYIMLNSFYLSYVIRSLNKKKDIKFCNL